MPDDSEIDGGLNYLLHQASTICDILYDAEGHTLTISATIIVLGSFHIYKCYLVTQKRAEQGLNVI